MLFSEALILHPWAVFVDLLGTSWGGSLPSWGGLGPSWRSLWSLLEPLGRLFEHFCGPTNVAFWEGVKTVQLFAVFGASWEILGPSRVPLGRLFEHFFGILVPEVRSPRRSSPWNKLGPAVLSLLQAKSPNPQTVLRFQVQIPGFRIQSKFPHAGLSIKQ